MTDRTTHELAPREQSRALFVLVFRGTQCVHILFGRRSMVLYTALYADSGKCRLYRWSQCSQGD